MPVWSRYLRNPKSQNPNPKETPTSKSRNLSGSAFPINNLIIKNCLELGIWDLDLSPLGGRIPEGARQAERSKNRNHFVGAGPSRFYGQAIRVPRQRELPQLIEIDQRFSRNSMRSAPRVDGLFRPEEEHGCSGMNDVVPPVRCRNGEVRDIGLRNRLTSSDFKR
jgi:hypothetical protein